MKASIFILQMTLMISSCGKASLSGDIPSAVSVSGGEEVEEGAVGYRSVVGIAHRNVDGKLRGHCSGVVIGKKMVLTAAHCGSKLANYPGDHPTHVLFGSDFRDEGLDDRVEQGSVIAREVLEWLPHPGYIPHEGSYYPDVALILLKEEIPEGWNTASWLQEVREFPNDTPTIHAGFGENEQAEYGLLRSMESKLLVVTLEDGSSNLSVGALSVEVADGRTECAGDSGGPVFLKIPGTGDWIVAGVIVDASADCFRSPAPKENTRHYSYDQYLGINDVSAWLKKTVGEKDDL